MTVDRHEGRGFSYDVLMPGTNWRVDEIRSALGRVQLSKLEKNNHKRSLHHAAYVNFLRDVEGISIPFHNVDPIFHTSNHVFPVLLRQTDIRHELMQYLKEQGIQTSIHYPSMDEFSFYKNIIKTPPVAKDISSRTITLPLYPEMGMNAIEYICDAMRIFMKA